MIFPGSLPHLSADYHGQAAACGSVPAAASMLADLNSASLAMAQSGYTAAGHHHHHSILEKTVSVISTFQGGGGAGAS